MRDLLRDVLLGLTLVAILTIRLTREEIDEAIDQAKRRVGPELAELLEAPSMTEEEMDAADQDRERDGARS